MSLATKFGRNLVSEPPSSLAKLHFHRGTPLKEVDHEPKIAVLDQEDLLAQGIRTSKIVPGARDVDALGSCTAQANVSALSNLLTEQQFMFVTGCTNYQDTKNAEIFAIEFYHADTMESGNPAQEWPPNDCGSSGLFVFRLDHQQGYVGSEQIAHGPQNIVSLLQTGGLMVGQPFLNAWMEPDANGFIDGDGSMSNLEAQIQLGVAGGHETYLSAIEKLVLTETGQVVPEKTIIRFRNSWSKSYGDNGSYRAHLSTYYWLGQYCDFRLFSL